MKLKQIPSATSEAMEGSVSTASSHTSNTLTHTPAMAFLSSYSQPNGGADVLALFEAIQSGNRHGFLQPTPSLPNASLQLAKSTLDAYAPQLSEEQHQRQREASKKRKRPADSSAQAQVLKIKKLHIDGFESGQIWEQARRIIASTLQDSEDAIQELQDNNEIQHSDGPDVESIDSDEDASIGPDEVEDADASEEDSSIAEDGLEDDADILEEDGFEDEEDLEGVEDSRLADASDEVDGTEGEDEEDDDEEEAEEFVQDPDGVNDGFFSIDSFNKQTQYFEDQDAKANPNTDQASDDEDFDWHADLAVKAPASGPSKKGQDAPGDDDEMPDGMEEDDDDEAGGPTFGDMDLNAPEGESDMDDEDDEMDDGLDTNANDVFYKDFFAPPPRKGAKNGKPRKPREPFRPIEPDDHDVDRAMEGVRRDLFDDESEREDSDDALSDVSAGDLRSRKSAHERRQAKLAEEIRKLESANVEKRSWTLAGEAKAADRPMNSLLEEDLDFEHIGKPVSAVTAEVTENIEDMIKRRILAQEFDEVIRRRPGADDFTPNARRGLVDVDDSKAKQGLAEIYEEEHIKNANPDTYVSKSDEKLRKEEQEIEQMWKDVSARLDALSSWHYKPKPAAPSLTVVSEAPTITMEDVQPTTAQGVSGGDNTLAPQEIYKAGKDTAEKGEVVTKAGLPLAREEMSREDKARRRRRDKERTRKAGTANGNTPQNAKTQARKDTLNDLKKGGVKVINKKGEVVGMDGSKAKDSKAPTSNNFKL